MIITKRQLKQIIKEELESVLKETQIERAKVTAREGPASFHNAVVVLKKGTPVKVLPGQETKSWIKVRTGENEVWIPKNALVAAAGREYQAIDPEEAGSIKSTRAALAAAAKG